MMKNYFTFDFSHFRGDLFGGLTAGIVTLPLALAFGVSPGLGPSAGCPKRQMCPPARN